MSRVDSPCQRVRHGLPVCAVVDLVGRLRNRVAELEYENARMAAVLAGIVPKFPDNEDGEMSQKETEICDIGNA
jgi:hypothetical protein